MHYAQRTTVIEGNMKTARQAEKLFEHQITPEGKLLREVYEIVNFEEFEIFLSLCKIYTLSD